MVRRPRGRPRSFDETATLEAALTLFWSRGLDGTSLDDIAAATGVARPSLTNAFGTKEDLFVRTLNRFASELNTSFQVSFRGDAPASDVLRHIYAAALDTYYGGPDGPRGCFAISVATAEATARPKVRAALAAILTDIDGGFRTAFEHARRRGALPAGADPTTRARLAAAVLHSLAIRARAGEPRTELEAALPAMIALICGPEA